MQQSLTEPRIKCENNVSLQSTHVHDKWPVVKEDSIKNKAKNLYTRLAAFEG